MEYIFDTNIFIRSKNEMPADVWPTLWVRMRELMHDCKIFSSVKVKEEIERGNDDLTFWMRENSTDSFYIPIDEQILHKYSELQNWANRESRYTTAALSTFAEVADAYLIATAAARNLTIVTNEVSAPQCKRSVKIPDVCVAFGVRYCDLTTAFRELGVQI